MKINIVIVEDDLEVLSGLQKMLSYSAELTILESYTSAEDFLNNISDLKANVVLMDIGLPKMNGIECVHMAKPKRPEIQYLMCTNFEDDQKVFDALRAGASGYILKNAELQEIIESIHEIDRGGSPMSRKIARKVIQSFHSFQNPKEDYNLSNRETEILRFLSKGYRYKEIAAELFISTETVRTHIRNIYSKLQVQSRTEALNKYYKH